MRVLAALVGALLVSGFGAACGGGSGAETTAVPSATTEQPSAARKAAPTIAGRTLDGTRLALSDYRGRPVLVNVWSSW